jgi:hypothetical protein
MLSEEISVIVGPVEGTFLHAFHMALLACMIIATIGVFTSLMPGQVR